MASDGAFDLCVVCSPCDNPTSFLHACAQKVVSIGRERGARLDSDLPLSDLDLDTLEGAGHDRLAVWIGGHGTKLPCCHITRDKKGTVVILRREDTPRMAAWVVFANACHSWHMAPAPTAQGCWFGFTECPSVLPYWTESFKRLSPDTQQGLRCDFELAFTRPFEEFTNLQVPEANRTAGGIVKRVRLSLRGASSRWFCRRGYAAVLAVLLRKQSYLLGCSNPSATFWRF